MRIARSSRLARLGAARAPGQIIPILAVMLVVTLLLGGLLLDGALMFQTRVDLETIARHAAKAGANQIDVPFYQANCVAGFTGDCDQFLQLNANAGNVASASATAWLAANNSTGLRLPLVTPPTGAVTVTVVGRLLTVTITECYRHYIYNGMVMDRTGPCANIGTAITAQVLAQPQLGY